MIVEAGFKRQIACSDYYVLLIGLQIGLYSSIGNIGGHGGVIRCTARLLALSTRVNGSPPSCPPMIGNIEFVLLHSTTKSQCRNKSKC